MGVSLSLLARDLPKGAGPGSIEAAARFFEERTDDEPRPLVHRSPEAPLELLVELHPAAEPVRIVIGDGVEDGPLRFDAKTSTAGPGYHRHACALALELAARLEVTWEPLDDEGEPVDETGWLHLDAAPSDADVEALEEAFLDQLGGAAAQILELSRQGMRGFSLSLPAGHVFEHDGVVATPLGPRDEAWLTAVIADPRAGVDAFPWWSPERDARYFRDLALSQMWTEVRWRPPLTDEERAVMDRAATWIERAHGLDPSIALPWAEQSDLLGYMQEDSLRATRAQLKASGRPSGSSVGYRRRATHVTLSGGWLMTIPGELAERWEERGTFVAWDETRSIWFTSLTVMSDAGEPSPDALTTLSRLPPLSSEEMLELSHGDIRGLAAYVEEEVDGQVLHRLEAHAALGEHAGIGTLVFVDPKDREWALATWASLTRRS